jgi:IS66 Orf2 like protein
MRRSFDGLALAVRERLDEDPESGALFVFINKRANRIKALWFDRNGYCILYKRVHRAVFLPPRSTEDERPIARVRRPGPARPKTKPTCASRLTVPTAPRSPGNLSRARSVTLGTAMRVSLLLLIAALASACSPGASPTNPRPPRTAPSAAPKTASPPSEFVAPPTESQAEPPTAPARATVALPSLPFDPQRLMPHADSVAFIDVQALRALGLQQTLRWMFTEVAMPDHARCLDRLIQGTHRVVMSTAQRARAIAVTQDQAPDAVIACFARSIPDAQAIAIRDRAGLHIDPEHILIELGGSLVVGNKAGLRGLVDHDPRSPSASGESFEPTADVRQLVARLSRGPGVVMSGAHRSQGEPVDSFGDITAEARLERGVLRLRMQIHSPRGADHKPTRGNAAHLEPPFERVRDDMLSYLTSHPVDQALAALLKQIQVEPGDNQIVLHLSVPRPKWTARQLESYAQRDFEHLEAYESEKASPHRRRFPPLRPPPPDRHAPN